MRYPNRLELVGIAGAGALSLGLLAGCLEGGPAEPQAAGKNDLAVALSTVPSDYTDAQVAGGLSSPTLMALAPDGRIFVSEKNGALRIIKNNVLLTAPFLTVTVNSFGERGLLGVALDPDFASNRFVYVYYTSPTGPHNRVSRFTASASNPDVAAPGSEVVLLDLPTLSTATNHNAGSLHFGSDGKLYISVGDNANGANSQSLSTTLGKLLRINKDGTIPSDNPFFGSATGINRAIYALGFRNPFTFAVQRGSGRIFVNDVGENTYEEIDDLRPAANYGWPTSEGYNDTVGFTAPVYAYTHASGCAITGGDFYNPANPVFPSSMIGDYFFADYCSGTIRRFDPETRSIFDFSSAGSSISDVHVSDSGAIYYLERGTGSVRRITANFAPVILEAENAAFSGPVVATANPGFTGAGYLDFQHDAGDYVEFAGTLSSAASIPLTLRYANGGTTDIVLSVALNGTLLAPGITLPPTGGWANWGVVHATVPFPAGAVTLRFTTIGQGQPNIDHLRAY